MTVLELQNLRANLWTQMRALNDRSTEENRDLTADEQASWDAMNTEYDSLTRRIEREQHLEGTRVDGPVARPSDPVSTARAGGPLHFGSMDEIHRAVASEEYRDAMNVYLRRGELGMTQEQRELIQQFDVRSSPQIRALGTVPGTAGGYLVPEGFVNQLEQAMLDYGGMAQAASSFDTDDGAPLPWPTANDTGNEGEIVGESQAVSGADPTFGQVIFQAHMYSSKRVKVSFQLLQDSAFDIEAYLSDAFGERLGRIRNRHFTTGLGTVEPMGVITAATLGKAGGSATDVAWAELIDLEHSIDRAYRSKATYMFADSTAAVLRKITDGEGRYVWSTSTQSTQPDRLNGIPVQINTDVPAVGSSAKSILLGDMSKYKIRNVRGYMLLRLNELYAENAQVAFLAFMRSDGALIDAGTHPVKYFQNA